MLEWLKKLFNIIQCFLDLRFIRIFKRRSADCRYRFFLRFIADMRVILVCGF